MPRYFFNVHGETFATPDLVGRKLPDDEAARAEAKSLANELAEAEISSDLLSNSPWVEVVDYDQRPVAVIPATETAGAATRAPEPPPGSREALRPKQSRCPETVDCAGIAAAPALDPEPEPNLTRSAAVRTCFVDIGEL
ncbi:MAG: DUF6894 family protein [Sphingomicrobium sp.]